MAAKIRPPLPKMEVTDAEKISDGGRIESTSSIWRLGVTIFRIVTANTSKKPVEKI